MLCHGVWIKLLMESFVCCHSCWGTHSLWFNAGYYVLSLPYFHGRYVFHGSDNGVSVNKTGEPFILLSYSGIRTAENRCKFLQRLSQINRLFWSLLYFNYLLMMLRSAWIYYHLIFVLQIFIFVIVILLSSIFVYGNSVHQICRGSENILQLKQLFSPCSLLLVTCFLNIVRNGWGAIILILFRPIWIFRERTNWKCWLIYISMYV